MATMVAFLGLALICLGQWRKRRDDPTKWAGVTFGELGLVLLLGRVTPETGGEVVELERKATIAILLAFPYCLYRFSTAFEERVGRLKQVIAATSVLLAAATFMLPYLPATGDPRPGWFQAYLVALIGLWTVVSFVVATKLWLAGRGQPTVVRARLRVLSLGSVGLSIALIIAGAAQRAGAPTELATQLWALASAVLFFAGVAPPRLLVSTWRGPEQDEMRGAVRGLVSASGYADLETLLPRVAAVVGGYGAALVATDGTPIIQSGVDFSTAEQTGRELIEQRRGSSSRARVEMTLASGWLVVWVSPYTPFFGREELRMLDSVAGLFDLSIQRIHVAEREHQARDALEKQKEFAGNLIRSSSDGMLAYDRDFRYTLWNRAMERITGVPASEVLGQVAPEKFPFMLENGKHRYFEAALRGEHVVLPERYFDIPEIKSQGWFETSYSPLYDDAGKVIGGLSTVRDVTDRKEADELRAHLAAIVDSSEDAIFSKGLDGTILTWNTGAQHLYGYTPEEVVGRPVSVLMPPDRVEEMPAILGRIKRGEPVKRFETIRVTKDGRHIQISLTVSPISNGGGEIIAASSIAHDITERVRTEELLHEAKSEAERANRAKSEFLSRMSHELRTPLNAILGFIQLLEMEDLSEENRESLKHVHRAGDHLLSLINEILDISRIEVGKMTLSLEPVALKDVVVGALDLAEPLAAERNVELRREGIEECDSYVRADVQRLKQVLLNLLSNAIKYNRDDGRATVSCRQSSEGLIRITVSDIGRGIAADKMHRLFEPFDRIDADKWGVEGVGLGLALSKGLTEAMGGTLQGESTLGEGSSFWVELAVAEEPQLGEAHATLPTEVGTNAGARARGTVLYVEDNLSNAKLVQRIFEQRTTVTLLEAMQGRLALDLARQHHPDLILLDVHLPDLSGAEVLRLLRGDPRTADIPVAIVSADATRSQIDRFLEAGAQDYLTKPIDVAVLLALVDRTVGPKAGSVFR